MARQRIITSDFDPLALIDAPSARPESTDEKPQPVATRSYLVELPSGAPFEVLTENEADFITSKVEEYTRQFHFDNVADLSELDVVVQQDLMLFRMSTFIGRRCDYNGKSVDENQLMQRHKEVSAEARQKKKLLGIDKVARDRARGEGSVHERMQKLFQRAERFGIHRNKLQAKAIELAMELISMRRASRNCPDDKMRRRIAVTDTDIIEWIDTIFEPEFMQLDADFRANDQRMWIRDMTTY